MRNKGDKEGFEGIRTGVTCGINADWEGTIVIGTYILNAPVITSYH